MSAVWGGGMLGVAYYVVETGHLHIMPDAAEREDFGLLRRSKYTCSCHKPTTLTRCTYTTVYVDTHFVPIVLLQVQPRVILVSARVDDRMQAVLKEYSKSYFLKVGMSCDIIAQFILLSVEAVIKRQVQSWNSCQVEIFVSPCMRHVVFVGLVDN